MVIVTLMKCKVLTLSYFQPCIALVAQAQQEVSALVVANGGAGDDLTVSSSKHTL